MTREEVEEALALVLGRKVYTVLVESQTGLPMILKMGAAEAFRKGYEPDCWTASRIRGALQMLHDDGQFSFEEGE